ncbi:MAG: ATP-binding protein [Sulfolobales archaeon]
MHSYRTESGLRFVDREKEIRAVLSGIAVDRVGREFPVIEGGMITVIYGPKGCGKTTLFDALREAVRGTKDFEVVLVKNREEARSVERIYVPEDLRRIFVDAVRFFGGSLDTTTGSISGSVDFTGVLMFVSSHIARRLRRARRLLIVIDEIRADSDERLADFRGWLESYANDLRRDNAMYREKGGSIAVVALTSDALVASIRYKVGDKIWWIYMWNLPREAAEDLSQQLALSNIISRELGIGERDSSELLWRLAGGNPRALDRIRRVGIIKWVDESIRGAVIKTLDPMRIYLGEERFWRILGEIIDNIDHLRSYREVEEAMLGNNIAIYVAGSNAISSTPREPWFGEWYAYQIPAYYYALTAMHRKRSVEINARDIIEEALRAG